MIFPSLSLPDPLPELHNSYIDIMYMISRTFIGNWHIMSMRCAHHLSTFLIFISLCPYVISYAKMKMEAMVARAVRGAMFPVILITPLPTALATLSLHLINQIVIVYLDICNNV